MSSYHIILSGICLLYHAIHYEIVDQTCTKERVEVIAPLFYYYHHHTLSYHILRFILRPYDLCGVFIHLGIYLEGCCGGIIWVWWVWEIGGRKDGVGDEKSYCINKYTWLGLQIAITTFIGLLWLFITSPLLYVTYVRAELLPHLLKEFLECPQINHLPIVSLHLQLYDCFGMSIEFRSCCVQAVRHANQGRPITNLRYP